MEQIFLEFGLLLLPLVLIWREAVYHRNPDVPPLIAPLALLLAINISDMLPNATLTAITWLVAGALTGYAEKLRSERLRRQSLIRDFKWQSVM